MKGSRFGVLLLLAVVLPDTGTFDIAKGDTEVLYQADGQVRLQICVTNGHQPEEGVKLQVTTECVDQNLLIEVGPGETKCQCCLVKETRAKAVGDDIAGSYNVTACPPPVGG